MAKKPVTKNLNANSIEILNAIRSNASNTYREFVPIATADAKSIRSVGSVLREYVALQNEFLSALYNRIIKTIIISKLWNNPLSVFKRGMLEYGETIEEIFVNIAHAHEYDPEKAESEVFKREIPDVRAAFHYLNYKKFYKATIQENDLNQAFLSIDGVTDLIAKIVDAMYTAANYDEYITTKYMLAKALIDGRINVNSVNLTKPSDVVKTIKYISNDMEFLSGKYNEEGVMNAASKQEQYIMINAQFDATMDVDVLASAFNMEKADFIGKRVLFDGFTFDNARLTELFGADFVAFTDDELALLADIPVIIIDDNYFMIYDYEQKFTEDYNGQGLYWNYWLHRWVVFSTSPFANAACFVDGTPSVTSVVVSPETATVAPGGTAQFSATVTTAYFAPKSVVWSITSAVEGATIDQTGLLTIPSDFEGESLTVTATSTFDDTKYDTATVTISS